MVPSWSWGSCEAFERALLGEIQWGQTVGTYSLAPVSVGYLLWADNWRCVLSASYNCSVSEPVTCCHAPAPPQFILIPLKLQVKIKLISSVLCLGHGHVLSYHRNRKQTNTVALCLNHRFLQCLWFSYSLYVFWVHGPLVFQNACYLLQSIPGISSPESYKQ